MGKTNTIARFVRTFFSQFETSNGAKVTLESNGKTLRLRRIVDGAFLDPRTLTFVTQHNAIATVTRKAIGGEKRALTSRLLIVDPRLVPASGRRSFADALMHAATFSDKEAYGTTLEQRLALVQKALSQKTWPVSDQL